jgi:Zn-dependent protease with chaperone function
MAHEFSHILNGDMRINIRLTGIIFGIVFLASIGRILTNMLPMFQAGAEETEKTAEEVPL